MTARVLLIVFLILTAVPHASGGNRALLVGIGPGYEQSGLPPIEGPQRDVELARYLAQRMGFGPKEIRTLRDREATRRAILNGLDWVEEGATDGGRAFIYYSGHGYQVPDTNGDEDDGCDEVLVPVDVDGARLHVDMFILDDLIGEYLGRMARAQTVVMVDSCFSGTVTKSLYAWSNRNTKYLGKGASVCARPVNLKSIGLADAPQGTRNLVVLTATAQNEVAYGDVTSGNKGSLFTQAIFDSARLRGESVTFRTLRNEAARTVRNLCDQKGLIPFTPQLDGNSALFDMDLRFRTGDTSDDQSVEAASGMQELLERVMGGSKFMVSIRADDRWIGIGQPIAFSVASSKDGYLNLIEVEPNGNLNVIFPNRFALENWVRADRELRIPQDIGGFRFKGGPPAGKSVIVALVTQVPLNLYSEKQLGTRLQSLKSIGADEYKGLKRAITRSIAVWPEREGEKEFGACGITINVRD